MLQRILDWLGSLPSGWLYAALAVAAAIENVFPPFPADTVIAFGSFLAARGEGSLVGALLATLVGNFAGAALMYALGRRFGETWIERRFPGEGVDASSRLHALYERYGLPALFVSRFLPGVRAIVPPFAGALRLPAVPSLVVMGIASAIWYGIIAYFAFRVGADWERLQAVIKSSGRVVGIVAVAIALVVGLVIWLRSRKTAA
jgi:membrane protein DedA with SNARE-associated domain